MSEQSPGGEYAREIDILSEEGKEHVRTLRELVVRLSRAMLGKDARIEAEKEFIAALTALAVEEATLFWDDASKNLYRTSTVKERHAAGISINMEDPNQPLNELIERLGKKYNIPSLSSIYQKHESTVRSMFGKQLG